MSIGDVERLVLFELVVSLALLDTLVVNSLENIGISL